MSRKTIGVNKPGKRDANIPQSQTDEMAIFRNRQMSAYFSWLTFVQGGFETWLVKQLDGHTQRRLPTLQERYFGNELHPRRGFAELEERPVNRKTIGARKAGKRGATIPQSHPVTALIDPPEIVRCIDTWRILVPLQYLEEARRALQKVPEEYKMSYVVDCKRCGKQFHPLEQTSEVCEQCVPEALRQAAPDLYEALASWENDDGHIPKKVWNMRNAALAKARDEMDSKPSEGTAKEQVDPIFPSQR